MAGKEKINNIESEIEPSWEIGRRGYFFGRDYKENIILSEFGWNIPADSGGGFVDFSQIDSDLAADDYDAVSATSSAQADHPTVEEEKVLMEASAASAASPSNRSISSFSSDDPPPAASGVAADPPPETVCNTKKRGQKRIQQPRFAFVTKSEVDHLEDGYRWRKYGQKAVKNSPYPRSYYRCTNGNCVVKKRIERSSEDPSVVITTYEGQHCHHSVGYPRSGGVMMSEAASATTPFARYLTTSNFPDPIFPHPQENSPRIRVQLPTHSSQDKGGESQYATNQEPNSQPLLVGEGLLGDIISVPPGMRYGYG